MNVTTAKATKRSVVEAYCEAWMAGDAMTVLSLYHDDLVLTWPGRHHLAGVHEGQASSIDALLALQALTNRVPIEIVDVLEGERSVMVIVVERWSDEVDPARTMNVTRALEYSVVDDKLRTCRIFEADQPAIDDWIENAHARGGDI